MKAKTKKITRVFCHKGIIGIESDFKSDGLINNPSKPGQLGFVMDASKIEISKEALKLLKTISKSGDDIGDIDVFKTNDGKIIFGWLGGPLALKDPTEISGSNTYNADLLDKVVKITKNDPPQQFIDVVNKRVK